MDPSLCIYYFAKSSLALRNIFFFCLICFSPSALYTYCIGKENAYFFGEDFHPLNKSLKWNSNLGAFQLPLLLLPISEATLPPPTTTTTTPPSYNTYFMVWWSQGCFLFFHHGGEPSSCFEKAMPGILSLHMFLLSVCAILYIYAINENTYNEVLNSLTWGALIRQCVRECWVVLSAASP